MFSYFSRFLPPWEFHCTHSLLPPPIDFPPPPLPGSLPPVPSVSRRIQWRLKQTLTMFLQVPSYLAFFDGWLCLSFLLFSVSFSSLLSAFLDLLGAVRIKQDNYCQSLELPDRCRCLLASQYHQCFQTYLLSHQLICQFDLSRTSWKVDTLSRARLSGKNLGATWPLSFHTWSPAQVF